MTADDEGWYTEVYVAHDKNLVVMAMVIHSALIQQDWWRMLVVVSVLRGEGWVNAGP